MQVILAAKQGLGRGGWKRKGGTDRFTKEKQLIAEAGSFQTWLEEVSATTSLDSDKLLTACPL